MASVLPQQIPSIAVPVLDKTGKFAQNWWLFLYNISQQVLGNQGNAATAYAAQVNADLDADVDVTDALQLVVRVTNLEKRASDDLVAPNVPFIFGDEFLQQPQSRAQPVTVIAVGGSPFTYTAPFDGTVIVNGGTVSAVQVSRDGTNFFTTSVGSIPLSQGDMLKTTYSGTPNMTFFPR